LLSGRLRQNCAQTLTLRQNSIFSSLGVSSEAAHRVTFVMRLGDLYHRISDGRG